MTRQKPGIGVSIGESWMYSLSLSSSEKKVAIKIKKFIDGIRYIQIA